MGSKYRLLPHLVQVFARLPGGTLADPFCGSGVVAYAAKAVGKRVVAGDYLSLAQTLATGLVENSETTLSQDDVAFVLTHPGDGRSFVSDTFSGIFFDHDDLVFIDKAWSAIDTFTGHRRALALAALCLAAARKQPRGVFTISGKRYDDGRRQFTTPLSNLFEEAVRDANAAIFDNGERHRTYCGDAMDADLSDADIVYLDPPYTPVRDDNDYIKRYHFLEGLVKYWHGERILYGTKVRKIAKRYTPFSYKRTVVEALVSLISRHNEQSVVLSYSSNAYPELKELCEIVRRYRRDVEVLTVPHRYHFGTHETAARRLVDEYIIVCP